MSLPINWSAIWAACPLVLVVGACSPEPEPAPEPLAVSASIPIEGGSIELPDGARVEFPAGALTEEAEVTLRRLDCGGIYQSASFGSCRYAVEGPEELLVQPYQLRLPTRAPAHASQQTVDGLVSVIGSEDQADRITTPASTFGEFASWSEDGIIPNDACVMPEFEACGGELLGNWTQTGGCGTVEQLTNVSWSGPDPYASCDPQDHYVGYPFSISGGLEFLADSYQISSGFMIMKHELVTTECLEIVGETCLPDCSLVEGVCECLFFKAEGEGASGDDVWSTPEVGVVSLGSASHRYCIEGDTLTVEWGAPEDPNRYYLIYTRG
jgi:hypothetical protein